MEKRIELKKQENKVRKERFKFTICLILCIVFFLSAIYTTDHSINKLLLDESNTHAIDINLDEDILKVEIAGEKYRINTEQLKKGIIVADNYVKKYYDKLKTYIYSKI